jgi:hypothetical protein
MRETEETGKTYPHELELKGNRLKCSNHTLQAQQYRHSWLAFCNGWAGVSQVHHKAQRARPWQRAVCRSSVGDRPGQQEPERASGAGCCGQAADTEQRNSDIFRSEVSLVAFRASVSRCMSADAAAQCRSCSRVRIESDKEACRVVF